MATDAAHVAEMRVRRAQIARRGRIARGLAKDRPAAADHYGRIADLCDEMVGMLNEMLEDAGDDG